APRAAELRLDHRLAETVVEPVDEEPRPPVGHAHRPPSRGDRAGLADQLEEPYLAWTHRAAGAQIDPDRHSGHGRYPTTFPICGRHRGPGVARARNRGAHTRVCRPSRRVSGTTSTSAP